MNTTEQARQQWCPMVRMSTVAPVLVFQPDGKVTRSDVAGSFGGSANTGSENRRRNDPDYRPAADTRCVGDKCAMWRWIDPAPEMRDAIEWTCYDEDSPVEEPPKPAEVHPDAEWTPFDRTDDENGGYWTEPQSVVDADNAKVVAARRGFCGLAGRPEVMP